MSPFDLYDIVEDDWKWRAYLPQPISPALKVILCKLLQPALRRRYHSAAEVLTALEASSVPAAGRQIKEAIANAPLPGSIPSEASFLSHLNLVARSVQATGSISGATIYLPQTQGWYYLPGEMGAPDESQAAFSSSPQQAAAAATPLVQETPLFADDIVWLKSLPLVWRLPLLSAGAALGSLAMACLVACLVFCLGTILFALSTPRPSGITPLKENPMIVK